MREIDLKNFSIRTDLVTDIEKINEVSGVTEEVYTENDVKVSRIFIDDEGSKVLNKKKGNYTTIFFSDITDHTNFSLVSKILIKEIKELLNLENISNDKTALIIGLGNSLVTPDSLGPKVLDDILVTRHIYELTKSLEEGYRITSKIAPGVMGTSGIDTMDILLGIIKNTKPDFLIVVDALASSSIDRLMKTIQLTNTGISPGSGIGNKRSEISFSKVGIPVIALGVPTVVDAASICFDTMNFMLKQISYNIYNKSNKNKLIPFSNQNYLLTETKELTDLEKDYFLGVFGTLTDDEKRALISDVLTPTGYNLMVTTKEVDFVIDKLADLISSSINKSLHTIK